MEALSMRGMIARLETSRFDIWRSTKEYKLEKGSPDRRQLRASAVQGTPRGHEYGTRRTVSRHRSDKIYSFVFYMYDTYRSIGSEG